MPMTFNREKRIFEFSNNYIDEFIEKHKKATQWNETQLHIMVGTFINFIDTTIENCMLNGGYIGSATWIFEQLRKINAYMRNKKYYFSQTHHELDRLERSLLDYRQLIGEYYSQPKWLRDIDQILSQPHQLCLGWFGITGVNLERFQKEDLTDEQNEEAHNMIDEILTEAITTLKQSKAYQKAARSNHLYYDILSNLPEAELKDLSSEQLKDLPLPKKESLLTNQTNMMLFKQKPVPMKQETQPKAIKRKATDEAKRKRKPDKHSHVVSEKKQKLIK